MAQAGKRAFIAALPPPALLALLYIVLIAVGTLLLSLPIAQTEAVSIGDALFTATSAVTVTGLIVVDTGSAYSFFGEFVIVLLMQLGGLGLMTFAALLLVTLGVSVGIPSRIVLREELGANSIKALTSLARLVIAVALIAEGIGVALMAMVFIPEDGFWPGLWSAVFHTVSAFNNAGFSIYSDSLSGFVANPIVSVLVPLMFILGGLGFIVLGDLWQRRQWRQLTVHSKLMLAGTLVLTLAAWVMFALLEWNNPDTLAGLDGTGARILASFFQATTPRTAGFNTLDTSAMEDSTTLMTMALMFIGGGPTSTAGGIKLTTAVVLVLATIAFFKRRETLIVFGRSLDVKAVMEAMALTTISVVLLGVAMFGLLLTHEGDFLVIAFEAVSAFGTVGLSQGFTGELDGWGRTIIMILMFLGRVGPLTLGFFLATRTATRVQYPPGRIYLG